MGHVMDLPKSTLGVDVEHDFEPEFVTVKGKEKIITLLKSAAKKADTIILATDPDREGEAIASHVAEMLKGKKETKGPKETNASGTSGSSVSSGSSLKRIVFHEITKEAIEEAIKNPRDIDEHLVDAQTARRVLDRLVGYKLSPLLWMKVRRGLSAGRVQSVAVRLIVEREREIEKFEKKKYFTIIALLTSNGVSFELIEINGVKIEEKETLALYDGDYTFSKTTIDSQQKADSIVTSLSGQSFTVADILQKEMRRSPYAPFTTSTLQQEASRRLGFSSKKTMQTAQKLYEEGFITYHRTDSVTMAKTAVFAIRSFIEKEYGKKYVNASPRMFKTKQKLAQEAHEAIRPTNVGELQSQISNLTLRQAQAFGSEAQARRGDAEQSRSIKSQIGNDAGRLYEVIWRRAVASQMADAVLEATTVVADAQQYRFKATGSVVVFDGFLKLYPQALTEQKLPTYSQGEALKSEKIEGVEHETAPPPRYNEASLIATLEEKGIGRPSTYAPIISTIEERQYVEKDPSTGSGRFAPTSVGIAVNDFLVKNFADIDDIPFTVQMEDSLDEIAHGKRDWRPMIKEFYVPFAKKLEDVKNADRVKIAVEKTDENCPQCGSALVVRIGRFGKFLSCSTFPKCKFTKSFEEDTGIACPLDKGRVILKKTRRGRKFYGCSNYPACKYASWRNPKETGEARPQ